VGEVPGADRAQAGDERFPALRAGERGPLPPPPGVERSHVDAGAVPVDGPLEVHPGRCAWHGPECISTAGGSMALEIGRKAPDFTLLDQDGEKVKLSDLKGRSVVVFFYPKALTSG
jgi:hypothetical protein